MTTQFLLSLLGVGIAGGSFALLVGLAIYKWYKKEPISLMTPTVKDEKGLCYPLKTGSTEQREVHAGTTLVSAVDVILPTGILASELITPTQSMRRKQEV